MEHAIKLQAFGHLTITDGDTGEVLVDKDNAIHYGNISTQIALAMSGHPDSFIEYMVFGKGASATDGAGVITYRLPKVSTTKSLGARLYTPNLVLKVSNHASISPFTLNGGDVKIAGTSETNFEDITITAELTDIDTIADDMVFDEIGLFSAPHLEDNVQPVKHTDLPTVGDIRMLTHVIFHPIQKNSSRTLTITYTLRIQMGD